MGNVQYPSNQNRMVLQKELIEYHQNELLQNKISKNKIYSFTPSYLNIGIVMFISIGAMVLKDNSCCCFFLRNFVLKQFILISYF